MNRIESVKDSTHLDDPHYIAADAMVAAVNKAIVSSLLMRDLRFLVKELRLAFPYILWTLHDTYPYLRIEHI